MHNLRKAFIQASASILIAAFTSSCSAEAKKSRLTRRAEEFFKAGEYEKAKIEYTNLLRADPKDPTPFYKIGLMWLEEGAPLRAGPFLLRAKELAPARAEIRTKLAEVYIAVGGLAEARAEAIEALQIDPANDQSILLLADAARTPEEIAQAEQQLQRSKGTGTVNYHLASATLALRKNDLPALEPALQKAIAADPKSSQAHIALARYRMASRNPDGARDEFRLAVDLAPLRSSAHLLFAEFKAQTGARDEAIAHLNGVVKKAPDFLPAWILLAKYAAQKNFDEAIEILGNVFRRDPENFDARILESEFYITKGDSKKAIDSLKQLESIYSKIPIVKYQLARALLQNGDGAQAVVSLEQAIGLGPNYADAILLLAEINLRNGNPGVVVSAVEDLLKTTPNSERAQVMLADAYRALGRYDDSVAILRKQIAAAPGKPEPYLLLGALARQQNKTDDARQAFEKASELAPENMMAINQLVEMDLIASNGAAALQRTEKLLQRNPNLPTAHLLQGKIYVALREWPQAEAALLKALELNPDIQETFEALVITYLATNKLPEAASRMEAFLAKRPTNAGALLTAGVIYSQMREHEKAREKYEKLLTINPNSVLGMNNLANLYAEQFNELAKAQEMASKAHTLEPANMRVTDTLGWVLFKSGDYDQAERLLRESASKLTDNPEVQFHWGMASYMMGRTDAARLTFEKVVNSPVEFVGREDARRRLALLDDGPVGANQLTVAELSDIVKSQPNDVVALVRLGEALEKQGSLVQSADIFRKAFEINPKLLTPVLKLAHLYAGPLKKKEQALEFAKKARELAPNDRHVTSVLGGIAFDVGNYPWSYSLLQEATRDQNARPEVLHRYAWAAYSLGKVQEAVETMRRAEAAAPDPTLAEDAKSFLSMVQLGTGDNDSASAEPRVREMLQREPEYVPALMILGTLQSERGEAVSAIDTYDRVLRRFPDFAPAQKRLAAIYMQDPKNLEKAYALAITARKALPEDSELAIILAGLSYQRGEFRRVIQLLRESEGKKPLDALSLFYLGMSQVRVNQKPLARESLRKAVAGTLRQPEAGEAERVLAELGSE